MGAEAASVEGDKAPLSRGWAYGGADGSRMEVVEGAPVEGDRERGREGGREREREVGDARVHSVCGGGVSETTYI